jgi:preprotein translocase subunit SecD
MRFITSGLTATRQRVARDARVIYIYKEATMNLVCKNLFPLALFFLLLSNAYSEDKILTFRLVHPDQDKSHSPVKIDKSQYKLFVKDKENYWVANKVELDSNDIKTIKIKIMTQSASGKEEYVEVSSKQIASTPELRSPSMKGYIATLFFTEEGAKKIENVTEKNIYRRLAVILNNRLLMAPRIQDKITGNEIDIVGLSYNDIENLRAAIRRSVK